MFNYVFKYFLSIILLVMSYQAYGQVLIPAYSERIIDTTSTLSENEKQTLDTLLSEFEQTNQGAQIAVLMLSSLNGESIDQLSQRVFDEWKIGQAGIDNGILLLISINDRAVRIHVGYGFEGVLPDLKAKRIIDRVIVPSFQKGAFYQGIEQALHTIINQLKNIDDPIFNDKQVEGIKSLFGEPFGQTLLGYGITSLFILAIFCRKLFAKLSSKPQIKNVLIPAGMNSISTSLFTLVHQYSLATCLQVLFLTFVVSAILCGIFLMRKYTSGNSSHRGPNDRGGGFGGNSRGGFGGGGGGRSGGGGASGRW